MIWKKNKRRWDDGDRRIIKRFAIFPITCKEYWDDRVCIETRWFQTVYIKQEVVQSWHKWWWVNKYFCIEAEYEEYLKEEAAILRGE
jgi:hypothetical protein